jgi:hypothetical protein
MERVTGIEPAWPAWQAWDLEHRRGWSTRGREDAVPSACLTHLRGGRESGSRCRLPVASRVPRFADATRAPPDGGRDRRSSAPFQPRAGRASPGRPPGRDGSPARPTGRRSRGGASGPGSARSGALNRSGATARLRRGASAEWVHGRAMAVTENVSMRPSRFVAVCRAARRQGQSDPFRGGPVADEGCVISRSLRDDAVLGSARRSGFRSCPSGGHDENGTVGVVQECLGDAAEQQLPAR